ncbi:MAG TPA: 23S rRNA (pseudouridine(1915)-N(3))-methyltransferase RlmH [Fastidiosipila sp.]|nr:23S rRNA (pseudouridine(1915)-N(3))-methyltransferase RlmH [Fastidiosipila sp.]
MATLTIIACGQIKETFLRQAIAEYEKRLSRYANVQILEVPDAPDSLPEAVALEKEAVAIEGKLPGKGFVIALDIRGKTVTSEQFAEILDSGFERGQASLVFIIGGSRGLAPAILQKSDLRLSLSALTFPHQLARLILLEQCYRGFRILRDEPYHK